MSQWTHVLGVVRYDSFAKNVWPEPDNKDWKLQNELSDIRRIWGKSLPEGSEGPLEVQAHLTNRGPTLLITGDLRDFGEDELSTIVDWANESSKEAELKFQALKHITFIRDSFIELSVEHEDYLYFIKWNNDNGFFLDTVELKGRTDPL